MKAKLWTIVGIWFANATAVIGAAYYFHDAKWGWLAIIALGIGGFLTAVIGTFLVVTFGVSSNMHTDTDRAREPFSAQPSRSEWQMTWYEDMKEPTKGIPKGQDAEKKVTPHKRAPWLRLVGVERKEKDETKDE